MTTPSLKMLLTAVVLFAGTAAQAQFLPPNPSNNEYPYPPPPPPPPVGVTTRSSCNSLWLPGGWAGGGSAQVLLTNSWEGPGATGFAWQVVDPATWAIYDQGYYTYPAGSGVTDLNVGIIFVGPSTFQIDVSYHLAGVGHYVDIWDWNTPVALGGTTGGTALNTSMQLSCITSPTRISMDTYHGAVIGIVWEDPTNGIDVIAGNQNVFGPTFRISGTLNHTIPDIAYTIGNVLTGPPAPILSNLHIASYEPGTGIHEYYVPWNALIPGGAYAVACTGGGICSPCGIPATFEDLNPVSSAPNSLQIDAPDHNIALNWAYTYQIANDVFTRVMNWNPGTPPAPSFSGNAATVCLTDGSVAGLPATNSATNDVPVVSFDPNYLAGSGGLGFYIGWHTAYIDPMYNPSSDAYVAIQLNEDGTVRNPTSPYSFFGASNNPSRISSSPTIAMTMSDETPFLYTVFSESNGSAFWMEHRWVPWNAGQFKTTHSIDNPTKMQDIGISPNPFKDKLHIDLPAAMENEAITIRITDITGKTYGTYNNVGRSANTVLSEASRTLKPGNYLITVACRKTNFNKAFKVVKTD